MRECGSILGNDVKSTLKLMVKGVAAEMIGMIHYKNWDFINESYE